MVMFSIDKESMTQKPGAARPPATATKHGGGAASGLGPTGTTTGKAGASPINPKGPVPGGVGNKLIPPHSRMPKCDHTGGQVSSNK